MQNKPNLLAPQMNVNLVYTEYYENARLRRCGENKPNQTQNQKYLDSWLPPTIYDIPDTRYESGTVFI